MDHRKRDGEVSERRLQAHRYLLKQVIPRYDGHDPDIMGDLASRHDHEFRPDRTDDGEPSGGFSADTSLNTTLHVPRRFCASLPASQTA